MIIFIRHCFSFLALAAVLVGCGKKGCEIVPNSLTGSVSLNQASHSGIYAANGWAYASGGACGLIVYNTGKGNVVAYDRCSPMNPSQKNPVTVDGFVIFDEASGAKWLLLDGSPAAISECPLRNYRVEQQGNLYIVRN